MYGVRTVIFAAGVVIAAVAALIRWVTSTPLLGANLPTPAHIVLVVVFLATAAVAVSFVVARAYMRLTRRSQGRRSRPQ